EETQRSGATLLGVSPVVGLPVADTWIYGSGAWLPVSDLTRPGPRSLFTFTTDPVNNTIWMYGGVDEVTTFSDFWRYDNGVWSEITATGGPGACVTPTAAFDTDRSKLVVICADAAGTVGGGGAPWERFPQVETLPPF